MGHLPFELPHSTVNFINAFLASKLGSYQPILRKESHLLLMFQQPI